MTDSTLSSVRSAARLLKAFLGADDLLGVSELARRLDLGKSNVHRLLTTLAVEGLIERDLHGYRLGVLLVELGEAARRNLDLRVAAAPVLARVREQTRETTLIGVLDGHEIVYVDLLESPEPLRLFAEAGGRAPVHCTSSGKVLLASLPGSALDAVLAKAELTPFTPHTITDAAGLRRELDRVRARGWAETTNEREIGVASVAAAVRDRTGEVVAAISIGGPVTRLAEMGQYGKTVVEAAGDISRRMGWSYDMEDSG